MLLFAPSGFYGSYSLIQWEYEERTAQCYSENQTEQKYEFAADADIHDEILLLLM